MISKISWRYESKKHDISKMSRRHVSWKQETWHKQDLMKIHEIETCEHDVSMRLLTQSNCDYRKRIKDPLTKPKRKIQKFQKPNLRRR